MHLSKRGCHLGGLDAPRGGHRSLSGSGLTLVDMRPLLEGKGDCKWLEKPWGQALITENITYAISLRFQCKVLLFRIA